MTPSGCMGRRSFLASMPVLGLAPSLLACAGDEARDAEAEAARAAAAEGEQNREVPFGVQLYTVRDAMRQDVPATLAAVAEAGYAEVEFAGLHGLTGREMRAALDDAGLRGVSSHPSLGNIRDGWPAFLETAQELGQSHLNVPSIPGNERTVDGLRAIADELDQAGELAVAAGMRFGYHNHAWEHEPLDDGTIPMTLLLEETDPDLVDWQMDIHWTLAGGADPIEWLDEHAGRVKTVHVKGWRNDNGSSEMVDVGDGDVDWREVLVHAERLGLEHAFVEHDNPGDPLDSIRRSLAHLRSIGL